MDAKPHTSDVLHHTPIVMTGPNPSTNVGDHPAEAESQEANQALMDRQQAAFQVCERMFNALLAWATTRDVRYLLAAQRSLTAVQNQQGDT